MPIAVYDTPPEAMKGPNVDTRLRRADAAWDVGTITMTLMEIIKEDPSQTFATLEVRMRELGCKAHLCANPARFAPPGTRVAWIDGSHRAHSLWICLHGAEEARQFLREHGIKGPEENLAYLAKTGLVVVSQSTGMQTVN